MEWSSLSEDARAIWRDNAAYWDQYMGDSGNDFHRLLIAPSAERLLEPRAGMRVFEVACGAGAFARQMASHGVEVVASDGSEPFIERAKARDTTGITYHVADATDRDALLTLGEPASFDAVVSLMAIMDLPAIDPMIEAATILLKPGGRFVFTILHPVFMSPYATRVAEAFDEDLAIVTRLSLKISHYKTPHNWMGIGIPGQPKQQHYFHRSFSDLFAHFFKAGFALTGLEEPAFDGSEPKTLSWANLHELPPVLAARFTLLPR